MRNGINAPTEGESSWSIPTYETGAGH